MKRNGLIQELLCRIQYRSYPQRSKIRRRHISTGTSTRQRRDDFWSPTVKLKNQRGEAATITTLLTAGGFIRQNYAGIYQFLPLGLRVLEKLERLIDKHMRSLRASKVSLSSISSQALWNSSGRLDHGEMFKFEDRGKAKWLLAPTHEEEFTTMIKDYVDLPRDLPIRLYQVGRKYRDEQRPRGGLLRGREFIMKDLYTFDKTQETAVSTYHQVRTAYRNLLEELNVPFVEVRADSGNMGGNLSHEFHFPNAQGEDTVITCNNCDYAKNEEFVFPVKTKVEKFNYLDTEEPVPAEPVNVASHNYISKDSKTLVKVLVRPYLSDRARTEVGRGLVNTYNLKSVLPPTIDLDTGVEDETARERFSCWLTSSEHQEEVKLYYVLDRRVSIQEAKKVADVDRKATPGLSKLPAHVIRSPLPSDSRMDARIDLIRQRTDDPCPFCQSGKLQVQQAIEIGHTFHLGTRYSGPFNLRLPPSSPRQERHTQPFIQMGCHGIGVTRLIAAASASLSDGTQLQWPRAIAPYEVVLCVDAKNAANLHKAHTLYDDLADGADEKVDVLLDDRQDAGMGWKMTDSFYVGYPIVVILGKALEKGMVEVRTSRQHNAEFGQDVKVEEAAQHVRNLLRQI